MTEELVKGKYNRAFNWIKLISVTGGAQAIVQGTGLLSGILIIRLLPTHEYTYYTLANTILSTLVLLSDGGISTGVMAQGGKVWNDKKKLGSVLKTGLQLRKKLAFLSCAIVLPLLMYLLHRHGAGILTIALICLSLIPAFFASLSDSILEMVPKLHQNILPLQKNQINVSVGRFLLTTALLFFFPWTFLAVLANGIPRIYGNIQLKKMAGTFIDADALPDEKVKVEILKGVKKILPGAIYFCFSSQINIWIISILGSSNSIAEVGALGRLGMVLNLFSVLVSTLIIPRFARLQDDKLLLAKRFLQILFGIIILTLIITGITYLFPDQLLLILGNQYKGLSIELLLSIIVSCLGLITGTIYSLSISRSFNISPILNIGVHLLSQITLVMLMNLSSTRGVLMFSILDYTVIIILFLANFFYHLKK